MKFQNARIGRLQQLVNLEEQRVALQQEIDSIEIRFTELRDGLLGDDGEPASSRRPSVGASAVAKTHARGALKQQIYAALEAAGDAGVRVVDLAKALGTKPVNIHSWFHSTMKRTSDIKKVSGGHYRLRSRATTKPRLEVPGNGNAAKKRTIPSKRSRNLQQRGPRGAMQEKVLAALKGAGRQGITVQELAQQIGANPRNVHVWFATTGKKNPNIRKAGKSTYMLAS